MFTRVIVPLDGSELAERALPYAVAIAQKFNAALVLVRACDGPARAAQVLALSEAGAGVGGVIDPSSVQAVTEAAQLETEDAARYLESVAARLAQQGLQAEMQVVDARPADAILASVPDEGSALIVMSTHGRSGLQRLVMGSVAEDVLHRSPVPVLLVRGSVVEREATSVEPSTTSRTAPTREVRLGAAVEGVTGRLGEVHRFLADAASDRVTDLVVKHGFPFARERIVPLAHVQGVVDGVVYLDLDERGLEAMTAFTDEPLRGPDPDYVGPPDRDLEGTYRGNMVYDALTAAGAAYPGATDKPLGYPGGEQLTPDNLSRPAIGRGTPVRDASGEEVGEVAEMGVDAADGRVTALTVRAGLFGLRTASVPAAWVRELSDKGVFLSVAKEEVRALAG